MKLNFERDLLPAKMSSLDLLPSPPPPPKGPCVILYFVDMKA